MIDRAVRALRNHSTGFAVQRVSEAVHRHPIGEVYQYLRLYGPVATARRVATVLREAATIPPGSGESFVGVEALLERQFGALSRLQLWPATGPATGPAPGPVPEAARPRLSLVTDTINPPHLYGGVGTALIFATLLAERTGRDLRIITRAARADEQNFSHVMQVAGLTPTLRVEYAYAPAGAGATGSDAIETGDDELFITTSWWTTWSTLRAVPAARIIYLLQEDERMFYPYGDEFLRSSEVLANSEVTFLINTEILFNHLVGSGFANIAKNGVWFEPSFAPQVFYAPEPAAIAHKPPYRFMFYARPNNVRNLFYRGIEAVEAAVAEGILDPAEWQLCLVGKEIPRIRFAGGLAPQIHENLPWQQYAALVRQMDLGMSLMYTPHPSYPPLDLAASGAVVVTNRFAGKESLARYSQNIICTEPTVAELVRGIARGVELAKDAPRRLANHRNNQILRDWRVSFAAALDVLAHRFAAAA